MLRWVFAAFLISALSACASKVEQSNRWIFETAKGEKVICEPPSDPALTDDAKSVIMTMCVLACDQHGLKDIKKPSEITVVEDFMFGTREQVVAMSYLPPECLPYDRPPVTSDPFLSRGEKVPECLQALFKDGHCP